MDAATFFNHFDLLAEVPIGVAKLRELILQLAVRGKLVLQEPADEPAEALAKQIEDFKSASIGRATKIEPLPFDAVGYPVPAGWIVVSFGDLVVNRDGERIPVSRDIRSTHKGTYDYYGASGVIDTIDGYLFDKPLLLIGEDGANLVNRSTPIAFIAQGKYWVNNHAHVLDGISIDYLRYLALFINATDLRPYVTGTAQPKMNQAKMNSIPVAVPPLAEQRRIVAKVDRLMHLCDELDARQQAARAGREQAAVAALDRLTSARDSGEFADHWHRLRDHFGLLFDTRATIARLRQAILQLAVQGKLVPAELKDEAVIDFWTRVQEDISQQASGGKAQRRRDLEALDESSLPYAAPRNWKWVLLGEIAQIVGGVTLGRKLDGRESASFPYLRVANVQRGFLDLGTVKETVIPLDELAKYQLKPGDVLLTEGGDWDKLGRSAIWRGEIENCLHQNHIFRARLATDLIRPEWITLFTNSPVGCRYFQSAAKQTTNLASINMTQLRHCPIPLPPTKTQDAVLDCVNMLLAQCDELAAKLSEAETAGESLLSAAVQYLIRPRPAVN